MTDRSKPFGLLRHIALLKQDSVVAACPEPDILVGFPDSAPNTVLEHVAFCPDCRRYLQILNTGSIFTAYEPDPDWERLMKRIRRSAHWELIKERIRLFARDFMVVFPDIQWVATRQASSTTAECTLIIFEINLTDMPSLSPRNLSVSRLQHEAVNGRFFIEIAGFHPQLAGADARLGIARQSSIINACGNQLSRKDDLPRVEAILQDGFEQQNGLSEQFDRLIEEAVWLDGKLENGESGARLVLSCQENVSSLFFRKDVWSMLMVSRP